MHTAFALNGLEEHRHHVRVASGGAADGLGVVERHADEALDQRFKAGLHLGVAGGAQSGDGAAMKSLFIDHHLGPRDAFVVTKFARQLERGLVGLEPAGAEKHIAQTRALDQQLRQLFGVAVVVVVADVHQGADLLLQGWHQLGVRVPERIDGDAAQRIEVGLAVHVPDAATLAVRELDRQAPVGVHDVRLHRGGWQHGSSPDRKVGDGKGEGRCLTLGAAKG